MLMTQSKVKFDKITNIFPNIFYTKFRCLQQRIIFQENLIKMGPYFYQNDP